jgi:neutral amino acid transport system ATP-binding protein
LSSAAPILELENVSKWFGGATAVAGASFAVERGSITALIGPNGAGKTTLFNVVSGFSRPDAGRVRFDGIRIDGSPPHRIVRRGLVRTFQLTKTLTRMTVLENMLVAAPAQPGERLWRLLATPGAVRRRERQAHEQARELLALVRFEHLAGDYAGVLSGGQRKLLELARALMAQPTMMLLDEPMAGVNPALGLQLLEHVRLLQRERGITFLLIEHDMEVVMTISERVVVMSGGTVIADGPPDAVRRDEAVIDAYLGTPRTRRQVARVAGESA